MAEILDLSATARKTVFAYVIVSSLVLALMMLLGLIMRLAQGAIIQIPPDLFYQMLTAHGIGMVGIAGLGGAVILWYFLSQYVRLSTGVFIANLVLFLIGVVFILGAIFIGGFAGLWTFLYPLPAMSNAVWGANAAGAYLIGVLLVGVGFLLLFLDTGRAIISRYGGLGCGLGWPQLFRSDASEAPPTTVVAATMVTIINVLALLAGATILLISIVTVYAPEMAIDPLLAKNLIFFFGHVFINAAIYMGIIAVYEILPRYTGRPWKATKPFLAAWTASTIMVLIVYPHHLLMDFAMPEWALWMGQIISYTSGLPVLAVTAVGTLAVIYRSSIRWDVASGLLVLSVFGWSAGILPAIVDATIVVNQFMHNTQWVPGHFHFYLLLGMAAMFFGFMCWLGKGTSEQKDGGADWTGFWLYSGGGLAFVFVFLLAGYAGVARRWAVHLPEWMAWSHAGSFFAALAVAGVLALVVRFIARSTLAAS